MSGYGVVYEIDTHGGKDKTSVQLIPRGISCTRKQKVENEVDQLMHAVYRAEADYKEPLIGVMCRKCATRLQVHYCKNRLYAIRCKDCEAVTLVAADNPMRALLTVGERWWEGNGK